MQRTRFAPGHAPESGGPALRPAIGWPAAAPAPTGRGPRREISATTRPSVSCLSELPLATGLGLSTRRELAQRDAYIVVRRCSPEWRVRYSPPARRPANPD